LAEPANNGGSLAADLQATGDHHRLTCGGRVKRRSMPSGDQGVEQMDRSLYR
jgi:hypothetical protein